MKDTLVRRALVPLWCLGAVSCGVASPADMFTDHIHLDGAVMQMGRMPTGSAQGPQVVSLSSQPMEVRPGDSMMLGVPFSGGAIQSVNIGFGGDRYFQIPATAVMGREAGTLQIPATLGEAVCDDLSSICHQIECYEQVQTAAGTVSKAQAQRLVLNCKGGGSCLTPPGGSGGGSSGGPCGSGCGAGAVCVTEQGGASSCWDRCTTGAECVSGCCATLANGTRACGPKQYCPAPPPMCHDLTGCLQVTSSRGGHCGSRTSVEICLQNVCNQPVSWRLQIERSDGTRSGYAWEEDPGDPKNCTWECDGTGRYWLWASAPDDPLSCLGY